ncbi:MAG: FecR domain-containing protein [Planctomycetota bacterium]
MMDHDSNVRWLEQIAAYQDGALSDAEFEAFEQTLQTDAEKRAFFIQVNEQSVTLAEVIRSRVVSKAFDEAADTSGARLSTDEARCDELEQGRTSFRPALALIAAVAAGLLLLVSWMNRSDQPTPDRLLVEDRVGTVTFGNQAVWATGQSESIPSEVTTLVASTKYELESGITRIKLSGGAVVSMSAPATFSLNSGTELDLESGKMAARLPGETSELTVRVGEISVRDLGTSFGVTAAKAGRVDVAVFDGKVSVTKSSMPSSQAPRVFVEGEAFSSLGSEPVRDEQAFDPESYRDIWPLTVGVNEISNVVDFVVPGSGKPLADLKDDHKLFLIPEQLNTKFDSMRSIKLIQPGQTWPQALVEKIDLPTRQSIHSYLLVYQPETSRFARGVTLSGSVEFEKPIIGVAATRDQLLETDVPFGLDAIDYSTLRYRKLEETTSERSEIPADTVSIDSERHRVFFNLSVGAGRDHLRVLVQGD